MLKGIWIRRRKA